MTEFKFTSSDPEGLLSVLGEAWIEFDNAGMFFSKVLIGELRDQLRPQVKPAIEEEPTGDVVVWSRGAWWKPRDGDWHARSYGAKSWAFVATGDPASFAVYRREVR